MHVATTPTSLSWASSFRSVHWVCFAQMHALGSEKLICRKQQGCAFVCLPLMQVHMRTHTGRGADYCRTGRNFALNEHPEVAREYYTYTCETQWGDSQLSRPSPIDPSTSVQLGQSRGGWPVHLFNHQLLCKCHIYVMYTCS